MASSALPAGLPPVEIDGEHFWDGGLVSNTPLTYLLDARLTESTLVFQVDLFSALGELPRDLAEVEDRRKDIVYSSRTRMNTDYFRKLHALRRAIVELHERLPVEARNEERIKELRSLGEDFPLSIVHLIYRRKNHETHSKGYEFSRASMLEHWKAGVDDTHRTLRNPTWLQPPAAAEGVRVFDLTRAGVN
jgi:NTE family protein